MVTKTPFGQKWTFFQLANNGYHYLKQLISCGFSRTYRKEKWHFVY